MRNRRKNSSLGVLVGFGLAIAGALFVYNSSMFEREAPAIELHTNGYWNLKEALKLDVVDESGLKYVKVTMKSKNEEEVLHYEKYLEPKKAALLEIKPPRSAYAIKESELTIVVEAGDESKWNFLEGNQVRQEYKIKTDKQKPSVAILSNSYKISKGGVALVVFKAEDANLEDIYIQTNFDKKFKPQPFYKEGYYISLLAWPIQESNFKATVVVSDKASNVSKVYIPLYLQQKNYKVSNIKLTERFLKGKIAELAEEFVETQGVEDSEKQFRTINEDVRKRNEILIHEITSKVPQTTVNDFKINKMYPLKNAQVVAHFGDHRKYSYNGKDMGESYHLGLDLASNAMAAIKPQNGGEVVYANYNGLYGHMPIVYHGLGLYTLYGHCSSLSVNTGDTIEAGQTIANSGKSGYAMGDHLHFGVLVQGIEVHPAEWMDDDWIKLNIYNVMQNAKALIDKN
ncbi:MAG: M23 family metallopeptidase [Thiovulaceae bacterium]|nr:M23 family metallopeptidase [Sulfurimonadaceae bacterium]